MTEVKTMIIVDCETGEQSERPMTEQEIASQEAMLAESARIQEENAAAAEAQASAKASANAKLASLGLTPEEIAALTK